jgi:hypothetical protein
MKIEEEQFPATANLTSDMTILTETRGVVL